MNLLDLRNTLSSAKPVDTEEASKYGYGALELSHQLNMNPDEVRELGVQEAIQRRQIQLGEVKRIEDTYQDTVLGNTRPESSANVRALTPEQRLQSYISGSNKDPELAYDLENTDESYLEAKYGQAVANYAAQ